MPEKHIGDSIPIAWIEEKIRLMESSCETTTVATLRSLISWWFVEKDDYYA